MKTKKPKKTKISRKVNSGRVYIKASFNNTMVTVTDENGQVLVWGSSGRSGFKGTRKSTPYAATTAVETALRRSREEFGLTEVGVYIKGPGSGRDAALRAIRSAGLQMNLIADVTPIPFNGPKAKKKRRV